MEPTLQSLTTYTYFVEAMEPTLQSLTTYTYFVEAVNALVVHQG